MFVPFTYLGLSGLLLGLPISAYSSEMTSTQPIQIQITTEYIEARGVLKAKQSANLAAPMSARILKAPYKPGQHFKRGALLVSFDCERLQAERRAIEEAKSSAVLKHENTAELLRAGAAGGLEETLAAAEVRKADAELGVAKARLKDCNIYAPYAGTAEETFVSAYDMPAAGAPLLSIIRYGAPEIELIAPSAWLAWLKPGTKLEFQVDETGKTHSAIVVRTGASVDPVSQTIELTAKFTAKSPGALAGMSGVARFTLPAQ